MKRFALFGVLICTAVLVACPQVPVTDDFFATHEGYGGAAPVGATLLGAEEFKTLALQEDFTWDSLKAQAGRKAQLQTQFQADETAVKQLAAQYPAYQKALKPDPNLTVLPDGNYLLTVQGKSGPFEVVTDGPRSLYRDMLESRQRFQNTDNQWRVYRSGFDALPANLKTGLATPESLSGASLETLLNARKALAQRLADNPDTLEDAKPILAGAGVVRPQVNPNAKPGSYPASPDLEEGAGKGIDHRNGNGCDFNTFDASGLYQNFWWKQKFYATSVKSQGRRGSCVAFALTAALETRIAIETGRWVNLSEQSLWAKIAGDWDPREFSDGSILSNRAEDFFEQSYRQPLETIWNYNQSRHRPSDKEIKDNDLSDEAAFFHSCQDYPEFCSNTSHQRKNVCTSVTGQTYCGYQSQPASGERFKESEPDTIFDWYNDVFGLPVDEMRALLKQGHPMVAGLLVNTGFDNPNMQGLITTLSDDKERGRHAVQVVGFISANSIQNHPGLPATMKTEAAFSGGGYFIIKNSWGYCYGDAGYVYVPVNWAKEYFTSVTVFAVTPNQQFKTVPNVPPTIQITAPSTGSSFPYAKSVTYTASASDPDGDAPNVTWVSDKDGVLGTGSSITAFFSSPGARIITATATDSSGATATDTISVSGVNTAPTASIAKPLAADTIYKGVAISLVGAGTDNDTGGTGFPSDLPCSSLSWASNVDGALGTGCTLEATFNTLGPRSLTLTVTDANGATGSKTVTINVQAVPTKGPPIVQILKPIASQIVQADAKTTLSYSAVDPDGGTPLSVKWSIRYQNGSQTIEQAVTPHFDALLLRNYFIASETVPFSCGGRPAELILNVTDPQGEQGTDSVSIYVYYPPC